MQAPLVYAIFLSIISIYSLPALADCSASLPKESYRLCQTVMAAKMAPVSCSGQPQPSPSACEERACALTPMKATCRALSDQEAAPRRVAEGAMTILLKSDLDLVSNPEARSNPDRWNFLPVKRSPVLQQTEISGTPAGTAPFLRLSHLS